MVGVDNTGTAMLRRRLWRGELGGLEGGECEGEYDDSAIIVLQLLGNFKTRLSGGGGGETGGEEVGESAGLLLLLVEVIGGGKLEILSTKGERGVGDVTITSGI
jgi:hypothetical protein